MNCSSFARVLVGTFLILLSGEIAAGSSAGGPSIKVDSASQNFGKTFTGLQLSHTFKIRNDGDAELVIDRIDFDAGCYLVGEYSSKIPPGKSIELSLATDARKIEGAFVRTATILSNDPAMPRLTLRMTGICSPPIELEPPFAGFGKIIDGQARETSVAIRNKTDNPYKVSLATEEDELYTFKLTEVKPDKEYRLDVKTKTPLVQGRLESLALLYTTLEAQPEIQVKVFAYVPPRLEVIPTFIFWDPASLKSPGVGFRSVLLFSNNGDRPVKVTDVTIDDREIKVTTTPIMEGQSYRILVEAPPKYTLPEMGKTLTINTTDSFFPTIRIPVRPAPTEGQLAGVDESGKELTIDKLVDRKAPRFNLTTIEGIGISNSDLSKSITLLNFFAPGDRHNHEQLIKLEAVRRVYADRGVRIVNVCGKSDLTDVPQDRQIEIMQDAEMRSELAFDLGNEVGRSFKLLIYPTLVILNKAGVVEGILEGNEESFVDDLTKRLDILLTGRSLADGLREPTAPQRPEAEVIGKTTPDFSIDLGNGRTFTPSDISSYAATVLCFIAVDDDATRKQLPIIEAAASAYATRGVKFIHVNQTVGRSLSKDEFANAIKSAGLTAPAVHDPSNSIGAKFKVSSYPTLVILRRDRTVSAIVTQGDGKLEDSLPPRIETAIKTAKFGE